MSILLTGQVSGNFLGPLLGGLFAQYWGARASVFSLNYSHQAMGICIGSFGGGALAARFGVNGVFVLDAVLPLINGLLVFALFPGARGRGGAGTVISQAFFV